MPNQRYGLHHRICNLRYGTHGCGRTAASYSSFSRSCLYMVSASVLIFRCSFQPESINLFFVILFIHNKFFFSPNSSPIVLTYCTILLVIQNSGSSIGTAQKLHFILALTNNNTNRWILVRQFNLFIQCRQIHLHLSSIFCFKFTYF